MVLYGRGVAVDTTVLLLLQQRIDAVRVPDTETLYMLHVAELDPELDPGMLNALVVGVGVVVDIDVEAALDDEGRGVLDFAAEEDEGDATEEDETVATGDDEDVGVGVGVGEDKGVLDFVDGDLRTLEDGARDEVEILDEVVGTASGLGEDVEDEEVQGLVGDCGVGIGILLLLSDDGVLCVVVDEGDGVFAFTPKRVLVELDDVLALDALLLEALGLDALELMLTVPRVNVGDIRGNMVENLLDKAVFITVLGLIVVEPLFLGGSAVLNVFTVIILVLVALLVGLAVDRVVYFDIEGVIRTDVLDIDLDEGFTEVWRVVVVRRVLGAFCVVNNGKVSFLVELSTLLDAGFGVEAVLLVMVLETFLVLVLVLELRLKLVLMLELLLVLVLAIVDFLESVCVVGVGFSRELDLVIDQVNDRELGFWGVAFVSVAMREEVAGSFELEELCMVAELTRWLPGVVCGKSGSVLLLN
jgi:hypothetical protein